MLLAIANIMIQIVCKIGNRRIIAHNIIHLYLLCNKAYTPP